MWVRPFEWVFGLALLFTFCGHSWADSVVDPLPSAAPLTNYSTLFGRVFVLNLPRRADRLEGVLAMVRQWGFTNVEVFSNMVDGSNLTDNTVKRRIDHLVSSRREFRGLRPTRGKVGHSLTYSRLLDHICDLSVPTALVLEDDARPLVEPSVALLWMSSALAQAPPKWDLIYFGWSQYKLAYKPFSGVLQRALNVFSTFHFAISHSAACRLGSLMRRMLANRLPRTPAFFATDELCSWAVARRLLLAFKVKRQLSHHDFATSDVGTRNVFAVRPAANQGKLAHGTAAKSPP